MDEQPSQAQPPLILIVDDDESARRLMQIMLERAGYRILLATTGEQALTMALETHPHLIILDDVLPGIWGDEVREQLKQNPITAPIRILMFTGRVDKMNEYRHRSDVVGVLSKPSHPKQILSVVNAVLS